MKFTSAVAAAAALQGAAAHTIFTELNKNGVGNGVRVVEYDGPVTDVTTASIACNGAPNGTPKTSSAVINVAAGSTAQITWRHTLTSGADDVIDASHKGPVTAWLKKVDNAATATGAGSGWFKIAEDGLSGGSWGVDRLIAAKGEQKVTIPSCIANGHYLLRGELIALHGAGSANGAQFYQECAQINVTGGSGAKSPATVSLPGAYKATDPGILINIYYPVPTSYTVPGPAPFKC